MYTKQQLSDNKSENIKYTYYDIEEYQVKYNRWMSLHGKTYIKEYEFGEMTASGKCWQQTGKFGTYNYGYAIKFCKDLNESLKNKWTNDITKFRVVRHTIEHTIDIIYEPINEPEIPYKMSNLLKCILDYEIKKIDKEFSIINNDKPTLSKSDFQEIYQNEIQQLESNFESLSDDDKEYLAWLKS